MKGLDLLAAHMLGDYILQTPEMAKNKLSDPRVRLKHVLIYTMGFLPFTLASRASINRRAYFLLLVAITHFITDSKRWMPNEDWPPGTILNDQALHAIQLAILSRLLDG